MKFVTFYFSGTGNTRWAVQEFSRIVIKKGHDCRLIPIEDADSLAASDLRDLTQNADYIGFANPIYGGDLPPIMKRFIDRFLTAITDRKGLKRPVYMINTFGYVNGFGPFCAEKLFHRTGLELVGYINIRLCNNISTPKMKVKPIGKDQLEKRKSAARLKLSKFVDRLTAGKRYIEGIGPYLLPNILVRKMSRKGIQDHYKSFSVNPDTCKNCMLCVKNCPTKSIRYADNTFHFLPSCTACMRCYNFCPTYSVLLDGVYADPSIYARYRGPDA
jgi:NAD-dependent dihydropyrimidine dehydrogenase PreA subunit